MFAFPNSAPGPPLAPPHPLLSPLSLSTHSSLGWRTRPRLSRAKSEFKIQKPLGSGGFGTTFLVTNLLDQKDYALKVVEIARNTPEQERRKVMREVELLSSLQSNNVVRYNSAWVEEGVPRDFSLEDGESDSGDFSSTTTSRSSSSCVCDKCKSEYADWEIGFEKWGLLDSVLQPLNLCRQCYLNEIPSDHREAAKESLREKLEEETEFLFILMEVRNHGNCINNNNTSWTTPPLRRDLNRRCRCRFLVGCATLTSELLLLFPLASPHSTVSRAFLNSLRT